MYSCAREFLRFYYHKVNKLQVIPCNSDTKRPESSHKQLVLPINSRRKGIRTSKDETDALRRGRMFLAGREGSKKATTVWAPFLESDREPGLLGGCKGGGKGYGGRGF